VRRKCGCDFLRSDAVWADVAGFWATLLGLVSFCTPVTDWAKCPFVSDDRFIVFCYVNNSSALSQVEFFIGWGYPTIGIFSNECVLGHKHLFANTGHLDAASNAVSETDKVLQVAGFLGQGTFDRSTAVNHSRFGVAVGMKDFEIFFRQIQYPFLFAPAADCLGANSLDQPTFGVFRVHRLNLDKSMAIMPQDKALKLSKVFRSSVHDVKAAIEHGKLLLSLRDALADKLEIVMRVYFEKPRTAKS
jgi:DAHP synthetase I family